MSTCKTATPPQASRDRKLKKEHNAPNNLLQETNQGFFEILLYVEEIDFESLPR